MSKKSVTSFSLFLFFVLFFLGLSLSINNTLNQSEEKVQADFQYKIQEFSNELSHTLDELSETVYFKGLDEFKEQALISHQNKQRESLAFYLYIDHKLVFWTNNNILVPSSDSLLNQDISCEKVGPHWLLMQSIKNEGHTLLGVKILQVEYTLQNEFLHDQYLEASGIKNDLLLSKERGEYEIIDANGNFLFSFVFKEKQLSASTMPVLLFFALLFSFVFFTFCLDSALQKAKLLKITAINKVFIFSLLSGLYLLFFGWLEFPSALFQSPLFQPQLYANLSIYSSLGQLFFISIWLFFSVLYFTRNFEWKEIKSHSTFVKISLSTLILAGLAMLYYGMYTLLISLVFDSQINLEITAITKMDFYSYTVLILLMFLHLSWFLLSKKSIYFVLTILKNKLYFILISFFIALLFGYLPLQATPLNQYNQLFLFVFFLSLFYLFSRKFQSTFWQNVYFLFLFISIVSIYFSILSKQKEEEIRKTGLSTYLLKNDPILESNFLMERQKILSDSIFLSFVKDPNISNEELIKRINDSYFKEASKNYEISMVFCDAESQLLLLPENIETPCFPFFNERIKQANDTIEKNVLYLVDQHFRTKNYIGIIEFCTETYSKTKLFVEFLSKYQPKELGIPALLSDAKNRDLRFFNNYTYAFYYEGNLSEWFGKFNYKQNLDSYGQNWIEDGNYFSFDGYSHFIYTQDNQNVLIVSKPDVTLLEQVASFAFLFLFYSLNISGLFLFIYLSQNFLNINIGFQTRLQINMVAILLFSFFIIGFASLYYLNYLNNEKNQSVLLEKAHSVLIELEHKMQDIDAHSSEQKAYLEELLIKFSQVFFTDINLYNLEGDLLATSRPQLFDSELLSRRMNPNAFYNLGLLKSSLYIHDEQIGMQEFYSVYVPFHSVDKQTVAYLNLPYFAKHQELEEEISGFLVAFLNIYMFLILLSLALTILISNHLSKPLKLLREKIQHIRLEAPNEKIEWHKEDEIGALILEYNRMVEELTESAKKLARSQRESAWREMAQQIAHEIKNPLTPMKLNIQYLEKAWKEGGEDFDNKLSKITQNLTDQIDSLSDIASQFSSFASLDQLKAEAIPVKSLIMSSIELFSGHKNIRFETQMPNEEVYILSDRNQLIRILNNLLKNAIQSMTEKVEGKIEVTLLAHTDIVEIQVADNGCGISDKEKPHVFEPRFTTKTGGMGLGLALVKKMTENAKGAIRFESKENKGTRFILQFPKHK